MQKYNFEWNVINMMWWLTNPSDVCDPPQTHVQQGKEDRDAFDYEKGRKKNKEVGKCGYVFRMHLNFRKKGKMW